MILFAEALFLLLTFLDALFTQRKIDQHGIQVELNPLIRKLVGILGVEWGVYAGILLPTAVLCAAGWYWPMFLSFMLGVRSLLFVLQLASRQNGN